MAERTLTTRALNRALLARQGLLERWDVPIPEALERMGGLQDQYAPSGYIGLWSRLRDLRRDALTEALEDRSVVQGTLLRSTIHLVSRRDYAPTAEATRAERRRWWQRVQAKELGDLDMDAVATRVRELLADGPLRQAELERRITAEGWPRLAWAGAGTWVDLVRVPPSGTWQRRRADLFGLASWWLGEDATGPSEADAQRHLVERYLGAFGPAPVADIATWAGLPAPTLKPIVEGLDLRRFRDEAGRELVDLRGAPLPDPDAPAPPRFLGTWDAMLLVHARRTLVLPEEHRPQLFHVRLPQSVPSFTIDGHVAGAWRHAEGRIELRPFEDIPAPARRALESEADRLAVFHAD